MRNIVLFGAPGAGKGTQADILAKNNNLIHISTGEVFRYNIKKNTALGKLAESYINKTQLVPDDVTIKMLINEIERFKDAKGIIFDGFPRTEHQADSLSDFLKSKGDKVDAMIALEVPDNVLIERILLRGKSSGRVNDQSEDRIRIRFHDYHDNTGVLKYYYQKLDKYHGIDGVGSMEEIAKRIQQVYDKL